MRTIFLILILPALLLAGCSPSAPEVVEEAIPPAAGEAILPAGETGGSEPAPADLAGGSSAAGACYHPYLPVLDDTIWTYRTTDSEGEDFYTLSYDITGPDSFVFMIAYPDLAVSAEWICTEEGLVRTDYAEFMLGASGFEISDLSYTGVNFPLPDVMVAGATWQNTFTASGKLSGDFGESDVSMEMLMDNVIEAVETITVPAGTYETLRIVTNYTMNNTMTIAGITTPISMQFTTTAWYAKDVGMVKSVTTAMGAESLIELVSME